MRHCLSLFALVVFHAAAAAQPAPLPGQIQPNQVWDPGPAPPADAMPPNMTRATFVSTGETRFDVRIDGNAACTTPCQLLVEPLRFVTLYSQERAPVKLSVGYMPQGDVIVSAKPRAQGAFAAGVTFTTLSGMGLATGITLAAVGYGTDRETMARAGLITAVPSAIGLYLSIGLIMKSLPKVRIDRAQPYATGNTVGVVGRF